MSACWLATAAAGQPNLYSGVVEDVIFFGHEKEITLSVAGQKIVSRVSGVGPTDSGPRVGDTVAVGWSLTAPVILQDCAS